MSTEVQLHHKEVIGGLLNTADPLSKRVLSAYSSVVTHKTNLSNIKKFDANHLEATGKFLGLHVREIDKKMYKNLGILSDTIILKIEALFETVCTDCGDKYCNKLGDTPILSCYLCLQGSHNCQTIIDKTNQNMQQLGGSVWLCSGCLIKNDPAMIPATPDSDKETVSTSARTCSR